MAKRALTDDQEQQIIQMYTTPLPDGRWIGQGSPKPSPFPISSSYAGRKRGRASANDRSALNAFFDRARLTAGAPY